MTCTATNSRRRPCRRPAVEGSDRCPLHPHIPEAADLVCPGCADALAGPSGLCRPCLKDHQLARSVGR